MNRDGSLRYLLPAIGAFLVFAIVGTYVAVLWRHPVSPGLNIEDGVLLWSSASIGLDISIVWCLCIAFLVIRDLWAGLTREQRLALLAANGSVAGAAVLSQMIAVLPEARFVETLPRSIRGITQPFVRINNAGVVLAVVMLVTAACLLSVEPSEDHHHARLADRMRWFRVTFYSAATLLGLGVYAVFRLFQWGDRFAEHTEAQPSSLATASGMVFTMLLAVVFLPPALLLNQRVRSLMKVAAAQEEEFQKDVWVARHDLGEQPLQTLGNYVALLAPAATGLLTQMLDF